MQPFPFLAISLHSLEVRLLLESKPLQIVQVKHLKELRLRRQVFAQLVFHQLLFRFLQLLECQDFFAIPTMSFIFEKFFFFIYFEIPLLISENTPTHLSTRALPICTALAPASMNSIASSQLETPPHPIIGISNWDEIS